AVGFIYCKRLPIAENVVELLHHRSAVLDERAVHGDGRTSIETSDTRRRRHSPRRSAAASKSRIARERPERAEAPIGAQRVGRPHLRPLREVLVPGPRLEIAEFLVAHDVHLAKKLDTLVVGVAMIGGDVVSDNVPDRPPDQVDAVAGEMVAGTLQL